MSSPKGNHRLLGVSILSIVMLLIVAVSGGFDMYGNWYFNKAISPSGWVFKQINNISEICIGLVSLYLGHRVINHLRTHDFIRPKLQNQNVEALVITSVWILAISYVVGNALR